MRHSLFHVLIAVAVLACGCSQHGDLPTRHSYIPAPDVVNVSIVDNGDGTYDIAWDVEDETAVDYYRIYVLNEVGMFEVAAETADKEFGINLFIPFGGFFIGISAVTVESVEGAMTVVVTPEPQ